MIRGRVAAVAVLALGSPTAGRLVAGEASPVMVQSAPGRFDVAAIDPLAAHAVAALAREAWRHLERPLALPPAFSTPVFVRLLPASGRAPAAEPFEVNVEAGGVVSVWWWGEVASPGTALRRALVRGLLSRLAVSWQGAAMAPTVPAWLEHAAEAWWETRADAARMDEMKYRAARMAPPPIAALLDWTGEGPAKPDYAVASVWLLTFLQAESGRAGEWPGMLRRLLAGMDPQAALATSYPGRFFGVPARELWWQTGWHHSRRVRTLPVMSAPESREQLEALARFVFGGAEVERDVVVPLAGVLTRRNEPLIAAEMARRATEVGRLIPALHPFYLNAGLSLAEALGAEKAEKPEAGTAAAEMAAARSAAFERDWRDALELETAANAALDALERRAPPAGAPPTG